jgi:hypothetical protein
VRLGHVLYNCTNTFVLVTIWTGIVHRNTVVVAAVVRINCIIITIITTTTTTAAVHVGKVILRLR